MRKNNIISRLRFKLIAVSMAVTLVILGLIVGGINFINFRKIIDNADRAIGYLVEHYNKEEIRHEHPDREEEFDPFDDGISPEVKFESRYFVVSFDSEGNVVTNDTRNIFSVSEEESEEYAKFIYKRDSDKGFYKNFRYAKFSLNGYDAIIFLDSFNSLSNARYFLFVSLTASFLGWISVFLIVLAFSGKIIAPVSKSYEKQKQFITDAGHEIKTPLAIIEADIGVIEIQDGENEWLSDIKVQVRRLTRLTNDLIHLSKLDEGKGSLKLIDFSISELATETINSFAGLAKMREKKLTAEVLPNLTLRGDRESIRELFHIILDNAIKYSAYEGNIKFELKKKNGHIIVEVSNPVKNLTKEQAEHLFERFYRADKSRNSQTGGHGIGLSMAKAIVEGHSGKIEAKIIESGSIKIRVVF